MTRIIAAVSIDGVIGIDGKIPWTCPGDAKLFRDSTNGHAVIMGRKTRDSLSSKGLPGRECFVVTGSHDFKDMLYEALEWADYNDKEVWIIGGGQIYEQAMPYVDEAYITVIPQTYVDVDHEKKVWFPRRSLHQHLIQVSREPIPRESLAYLETYTRRSARDGSSR